MEMQHCRSCGADIYWLKNPKTGKLAPIDVEQTDNGNIAIDLVGMQYEVIPAPSGKVMLRTNHFMTCPSAKQWHKHGSRNDTATLALEPIPSKRTRCQDPNCHRLAMLGFKYCVPHSLTAQKPNNRP